MRVLVTGAAGFIGSATADLLARHYEVARSDVAGDGLLTCDLGDRDAVAKLVARAMPECIVHCGAASGAMVRNPAGFEVNSAGTVHTAEAARRHNVRRIVLASSIAVYGSHPSRGPVAESAPLRATAPYGASKIAAETALGTHADGSFDAVSLRISSVFGQGRRTDCLLQRAVRAWRAQEPLELARNGQVPRQLIHISDAARALVLAAEAPSLRQRAYNISGGSYLSEAEIVARIASCLPGLKVMPVAADPEDWPDGDIGPLDLAAAASDLGYEPLCDLPAALENYVAALVGRSGEPSS